MAEGSQVENEHPPLEIKALEWENGSTKFYHDHFVKEGAWIEFDPSIEVDLRHFR